MKRRIWRPRCMVSSMGSLGYFRVDSFWWRTGCCPPNMFWFELIRSLLIGFRRVFGKRDGIMTYLIFFFVLTKRDLEIFSTCFSIVIFMFVPSWISIQLSSKYTVHFLFGHWERRIPLTPPRGSRIAFWTLPTQQLGGNDISLRLLDHVVCWLIASVIIDVTWYWCWQMNAYDLRTCYVMWWCDMILTWYEVISFVDCI